MRSNVRSPPLTARRRLVAENMFYVVIEHRAAVEGAGSRTLYDAPAYRTYRPIDLNLIPSFIAFCATAPRGPGAASCLPGLQKASLSPDSVDSLHLLSTMPEPPTFALP